EIAAALELEEVALRADHRALVEPLAQSCFYSNHGCDILINVAVSASPYARVQELLEAGSPVILDGGNATELEREHAGELLDSDRGLWGTGALYRAPYAVLDIHRRYVEAGCDVISANTWAILAAAERDSNWLDTARLGIR